MENLVVVAGNSNPELFKKIEQEICTMDAGDPNFSLAKATIGKFPGGEPKIKINRNLRGKTVYVLQSTSNSWKPDQNSFADNLVELLVLADACKRNSAERVKAIVPFYGGARQDKRKDDEGREPITAALIGSLLKTAGVTDLMSVDFHSDQCEGFFDGPVTHLFARPIFQEFVEELALPPFVGVSPDATGAERVRKFIKKFHVPMAIVDKRRDEFGEVNGLHLIGSEHVNGKLVLVIDDIVDTARTFLTSVDMILAAGAIGVIGIFTHGVFSGDAVQNVHRNEKLLKVYVTDTIPLTEEAKACGKIEVVSLAPLIAQAILADYHKKSIRKFSRR